ncbi:MAG: Phosphoglucomutase, partial [Streblomastix strix]
MNIKTVPTKHFPDSKAGTSGLRKPVKVFAQPGYVENFVQSLFTHIPPKPDSILVTGGDGRYYLDVAVQKVIKVAIGNGYRHIIIGQDGRLSTPAVSAIIRDRKALGGVILTASHNAGGPDKDFGMKYNYHTGAPAPESLIDKQYEIAEKLTEYKIADIPDVDISKLGTFTVGDGVKIEIIDSCELWLKLMKQVFDFSLIQPLFARKDFSFVFDALHGVTGRYAFRLFVDE